MGTQDPTDQLGPCTSVVCPPPNFWSSERNKILLYLSPCGLIFARGKAGGWSFGHLQLNLILAGMSGSMVWHNVSLSSNLGAWNAQGC